MLPAGRLVYGLTFSQLFNPELEIHSVRARGSGETNIGKKPVVFHWFSIEGRPLVFPVEVPLYHLRLFD